MPKDGPYSEENAEAMAKILAGDPEVERLRKNKRKLLGIQIGT